MTDTNTTAPASSLAAVDRAAGTGLAPYAGPRKRGPTLLEEMEERAKVRPPAADLSAIEQAGRDHLQLQEDNRVLIADLRQTQIDVAVLARGLDDVTAERNALREQLNVSQRTIGSITEGLGTIGEQILRVIKTGKAAADALPEEIERYRPKPIGDKIATGASADD